MSVRSRHRRIRGRAEREALTRGDEVLARTIVPDRFALDSLAAQWARERHGMAVVILARHVAGGIDVALLTLDVARLVDRARGGCLFAEPAPAGHVRVALELPDGMPELYSVPIGGEA